MKQDLLTLEQRDIYFFYRPRVSAQEAHHLEDIHMIKTRGKRHLPLKQPFALGKYGLKLREDTKKFFNI